MTKFVKRRPAIISSWFEIDASGAVVGRLATVVFKIHKRKIKLLFTPHMDDGDFVGVKNVEQFKIYRKQIPKHKILL